MIPEEMRPVANLVFESETFVIGDIKGHPLQTLDLDIYVFIGYLT